MGIRLTRRAQAGIVGAASIITILTLVSRVFGLLRKLAQSWAVSDGAVATAYDTANTVPNVLFEIAAGGALAGAVIPLVSGFLVKKQKDEAGATVSALLTWIIAISVPLAIVVSVCASGITALLLGASADPAVSELSGSLLTMFAWQVPLYGISVVCAGVLQAHDRFVLPALAPLLSSIVVIGVFLAYAELYPPHADPSELSRFAIYLLGWGTTAGVMVFSLPQFIPVMRLVPIKPTFHFPPGVARHTMHLAGAGLGALLAQQIAIMVIMYATNELGGVGTYNVFNYSFAVFMVPYAVLAVPIATVTFPQISKAVSAGDTDRAARVTARSTRLVLFMGILAAALLAVEAKPAQVVLEVGRNIAHLDYAMTAMAIGLIGYSLLYHGARVLYALDAGRYVIAVNSLGWGVVVITLLIGLAVASPGRFGALTWVGMALSVGMSVGGVAVLCAIRAKLGAGSLHGIVRTAVVGVASCAVLTWVGRYVVNLFFAPHGSASVATALLAAVLGALICVGGAACVALLFDRSLVSGIRS